jgi:hypothetical protein
MPFESLEQSNTRRIEILIAQVNILQSQLLDVIQIMGVEVNAPTQVIIPCPHCQVKWRTYTLDKNTNKFILMEGVGMVMDNAELVPNKFYYGTCTNAQCGKSIEYKYIP